MNGKLPVAIIWHMHQPYYKHPQTSEFVLPWVRLHASKDYLHMARLLQEFPRVKAHFTMVPSLRDQLEDYARGADDEDTRLTMRTVDGVLADEERTHILRRFFSIHHGNVIHRYQEYRRLLQIAMATGDRHELLSDDYFVDLALWFNLAWIDPADIRSDQRLVELADKGARFTREDVRYVIGRQRFMASGVPHLYHRLERDGQVEILTTPYYHPILPLIIDDRSALRADPSAQLPDVPFAYPDDAAFQLEEAIASHERAFGQKPRGVWPSEGAVSPETADAIRKTGLNWFASDEGVLARSVNVELRRDEIGALVEPALLYQPYRLANGATVIFRDRELSDRIGFVYGDMKPEDAVGDMIAKLERTRRFAQEQWGSLRYMPKSVRQPLMVAEGSDWFWWYSSRNSSPEDGVFDALFRANLEVVWWFAGAEPPDDIRSPLMDPQRVAAAGNKIGAMLPGSGERYG